MVGCEQWSGVSGLLGDHTPSPLFTPNPLLLCESVSLPAIGKRHFVFVGVFVVVEAIKVICSDRSGRVSMTNVQVGDGQMDDVFVK